jgi:hypothetical protein
VRPCVAALDLSIIRTSPPFSGREVAFVVHQAELAEDDPVRSLNVYEILRVMLTTQPMQSEVHSRNPRLEAFLVRLQKTRAR